MALSIAAITVIGSVLKEGIKWGGSMRKEAITLAIAPAVVPVYNAMSTACVEGCTIGEAFLAPSGLEWSALITGVVALVIHLNQKRKDQEVK